MTRIRIPRLFVLAALGAVAILALPSLGAAKRADRNHDGIPDRWEKRHRLSLKVNQSHRNQDREGLNNRQEFTHGTNPRDVDSDDDGLTDAEDVRAGDDPTDADSDDDGVEDGDENAGTVASFDGTTLTITLFAGGTMTGQVTEATEIECEDSHDGSALASHDGGPGEDGEDEGSDDEGSDHEDSDDEGSGETHCTAADLVPGTAVREAELVATPAGAVFDEVELVR